MKMVTSANADKSITSVVGPKLFVTPIKSNRHKIIHAIGQYCLAGSCNTDQRNKVLEVGIHVLINEMSLGNSKNGRLCQALIKLPNGNK